VDFKVMH